MNYLTDLWPTPQSAQRKQHVPLTTLIVPFEVKPGKAHNALPTTAQLISNITPLLVHPVAASVLYITDIS
jgi:hypothetical protein